MNEISKTQDLELHKKVRELISSLAILGNGKYDDLIVADDGFSIECYHDGEGIYTRHHYKNALSLIIAGRAKVKKNVAGSDVTIRILNEGDLFGVAALFEEHNEYVSNIYADGYCTVAFIPQSAVNTVFRLSSEAAIAYITLLSKKIRFLNAKLDGFTAPNAYTKLCLYLLENGNTSVSMQTLADHLGISRMTLYRNLDQLVQNGCIKKEGKSITILDRNSLLPATSEEIL